MPSIGLITPEIAFENYDFKKTKILFAWLNLTKPMAVCQELEEEAI